MSGVFLFGQDVLWLWWFQHVRRASRQEEVKNIKDRAWARVALIQTNRELYAFD
jgi:hypothetical protein